MNLKNILSYVRPVSLSIGLGCGLFLAASGPAQASDFCTDIPTCSDGKVLVLTDEEKRENCAMFVCTKPYLAESVGTLATPEMLAKLGKKTKLSCDDGKVALQLKEVPEGRENGWICTTPRMANYYRDNGMVVEERVDDSTTTLTCEDNRRLVHYKTKPKNAETAWACVHPMAYKVLKKQGRLVED